MEQTAEFTRSRLVPEVSEYRVPEDAASGEPPFRLGADLERLDRVRGVGASEAVIFYSARILETLARDALARIRQQPSHNAFSNLSVLEELNLLPTTTRYWAHALRRLGNVVRHVNGRVGDEDAALSELFLERWLFWFFGQYRFGKRLPALTVDGRPLRPDVERELQALLRLLEELDAAAAGSAVESAWLNQVEDSTAFRATPVPSAVLAEILLGRRDLRRAGDVLAVGLDHYPDDLRLRQLRGLYHSRKRELEQALSWLEPLRRQYPDDEETAGILAGVYKRCWEEGQGSDWLQKAHRGYLKAWKASQKKNAWLGINAATTAFWLDRAEEARRLAAEVHEMLSRRRETLARLPDAGGLGLDYWDEVALAEADLVRGNVEAARGAYEAAFRRHPHRPGDIKRTREQMSNILRKMGLAAPDV